MKMALICCLCLLLVASFSSRADQMEVFEIGIDNLDNIGLGQTVDIPINYLSGSEIFAGFSFLVSFDPTDIQLIEALPGAALTACGWEQFSVTPIACPGCDVQIYQIDATADIEDGDNHPTCLSEFGELAVLRLKMPAGAEYAGTLYSIDFYWDDCSSNSLTSSAVDTVWHGKFIYDYLGQDITDSDPNHGGTLPGCIAPDGVVPIRAINYRSGSVQLSSELGLFGDVNGDGKVNLSDVTYLLAYIFYSGPPPQDYLFGDIDQDGHANLGDAIFLFAYLFGGPQ